MRKRTLITALVATMAFTFMAPPADAGWGWSKKNPFYKQSLYQKKQLKAYVGISGPKTGVVSKKTGEVSFYKTIKSLWEDAQYTPSLLWVIAHLKMTI